MSNNKDQKVTATNTMFTPVTGATRSDIVIDADFNEIQVATNLDQAQQTPEPTAQNAAEAEVKAKKRLFNWDELLLKANGDQLIFRLPNGHKIYDSKLVDPLSGQRYQFVGVPASAFLRFTTEDAQAIVERAAEKGWSSIEVHGTEKHKNMLYRAAQEAGLKVDNYLPRPERRSLLKSAKKRNQAPNLA